MPRRADLTGWKGVEPDWFEMDLVALRGKRMEGPFLSKPVIADVAMGQGYCLPLLYGDGPNSPPPSALRVAEADSACAGLSLCPL